MMQHYGKECQVAEENKKKKINFYLSERVDVYL